jgi:uncharacterized membrane-anchored protein
MKVVGALFTLFMGWILFNSLYKRLQIDSQRDILFIVWLVILHLSWVGTIITNIITFGIK